MTYAYKNKYSKFCAVVTISLLKTITKLLVKGHFSCYGGNIWNMDFWLLLQHVDYAYGNIQAA